MPKGRYKKGEMNRLESEYAKTLEELRSEGEIVDYWYEGVTLRLAPRTSYTPDFMVMTSEMEIEMHEVKGFWRDDARVKFKVAADMYPFRFVAITKARKKDKDKYRGKWRIDEK